MCSACNVLGSEDKSTVVPCHIHDSSVELNAPFVYKYFHICDMQSGLSEAADVYNRFLTLYYQF